MAKTMQKDRKKRENHSHKKVKENSPKVLETRIHYFNLHYVPGLEQKKDADS